MTVETLNDQQGRAKSARVIDFILAAFLRLLSIVFFLGAIYTWLTIVGFWPGENFRFDTMPVHLKVYSAVMAVILPAASVGLWTTMAWGRVIWFFVIAFQSVSIMRFGDSLAMPELILMAHFSALFIYLMIQLLLYFIDKKA